MKLVKESILFQKTRDPRDAMDLGFNPYKEFMRQVNDPVSRKEISYEDFKPVWKKILTDIFVGHIVNGIMYYGDDRVYSTEERVIRIVLDTTIPNFSFVIKNDPEEIQSERWYYVDVVEDRDNVLKIIK